MHKRRRGFLVFLVLILMGLLFFIGMKMRPATQTTRNSESPPVQEHSDTATGGGDTENLDVVIQEIVNLAGEGKVPDVPFTAGESDSRTVHQHWGDPQQVMETTNAQYEDFLQQEITIGFQRTKAFDIRSFKANIRNIHLADIKNKLGEPDEVRYYQDTKTDQIILVYQVNANYQLKWILPKPTDNDVNPTVHHISVYTEITDEIAETINQMTLDEKLGQMMFAGVSGTSLQQETKSLIRDYKVGGLILYANNLETPQQTVSLMNDLMTANGTNRLPLFLGTDQEGGKVVRLPGPLKNFPTNQKIGQINQPQFSYEIGQLLGEQLKAFGFNLDFAPVMDVNSNPNNPIIGDRSFSNRPDIVSQLGIQTMQGLESQQVIPVIKHFPGHGDTSVDSHLELPKVSKSLDDLNKLELIPFKAAIDKGVDVVMVGHILLPKIDQQYPSSMSKVIITGLLRNQLGFDGVVMTDDMTMKAITNHVSIGQAAVDSVKAGNDIILIAHEFANVTTAIDALKVAVKNGEISEQQINDSVRRIIQLKEKYQLVNQPVSAVDLNKLNARMDQVLNTYMK
ncbi:MAG: beta-N-acetylhexosaminidase [Lysinibacillus fusiformis]|uniref:beta-N-acetylhexosaminidase n=1 Tax=Lysinibacillus fusiformis TaxID=28031 RepID=UPI001F4DA3B5|nr:beta-N-acetylhexosaminidase [Lysinibacillus fusiformis]MCK1987751.1 beta-N-acetylhexosaminidase [Lysinibacillus fusiformis]MCT6927761.1 beta-N-acetylhexosaminidase [Lysinibacillus fusiformis]MCT6932395.1 beta-N-acetylhexosaminidase [Lysinibacillus fusiformis]